MTPRIRLIIDAVLGLALVGAVILVVLGWHALPTAAVWGRLLIGVGLAGAIAIGVMFFLPVELRANLTLMGVAILLTLWLASWIVYEPQVSHREQRQRDFEAAARDAGVPFDTRTPLQVIKDLRSRGVDAATTLSAWVFFGDTADLEAGPSDATQTDGEPALVPLAGRSRITTVACNEQGDHLIIESDRYGYNNPDDVYAASSPILILGDSFAFGFCVRPGHDIGNQLRARNIEVVNLGYPGTGPLIQVAQLREYGRVVQPSVILWLYYHGNDLVNLSEEYSQLALRRYLDTDHHENLPARQTEIDALWAEYIERAVRRGDPRSGPPLGDVVLLQPLRDRLVGRTAATRGRSRSKAPIERFDESLDAMIAEAETLDAALYFVFLPTYGQFAEQDRNTLEEDRDAVLTAVRTRGLPIIDFETRLRETGDPLRYYPYRKQGHYTEAAYALLAEQILERLQQDSLQMPMSTIP